MKNVFIKYDYFCEKFGKLIYYRYLFESANSFWIKSKNIFSFPVAYVNEICFSFVVYPN